MASCNSLTSDGQAVLRGSPSTGIANLPLNATITTWPIFATPPSRPQHRDRDRGRRAAGTRAANAVKLVEHCLARIAARDGALLGSLSRSRNFHLHQV